MFFVSFHNKGGGDLDDLEHLHNTLNFFRIYIALQPLRFVHPHTHNNGGDNINEVKLNSSLNLNVNNITFFLDLRDGNQEHPILELRRDLLLLGVVRQQQSHVVGARVVPRPPISIFPLLLPLALAPDHKHVVLHRDLHVLFRKPRHVEPQFQLLLILLEVPRRPDVPHRPAGSWEGHGVVEDSVHGVQHLPYVLRWRERIQQPCLFIHQNKQFNCNWSSYTFLMHVNKNKFVTCKIF